MTDATTDPFVRLSMMTPLPPPASTRGWIGWARANLFSSIGNALLTILGLLLIAGLAWSVIDFAVLRGVFVAETGETCRKTVGAGACWPYVEAYWRQFMYGRYPLAERWRVNIVAVLFVASLVPLLIPAAPLKRLNALIFFVVLPIVDFVLLTGGWFGLAPVETTLWGGLLVTMIVAVTGIVVSLPFGILLALGRRSKLPVIRVLSVVYIEFWRGVPLITVLFMASNMLPMFLPAGVTVDKLLRALVGVSMFSAAYLAEVVRGGLQAVPRGQYEGAQALGLKYWQSMLLVVMPQALKLVIPGIVNSFISLFKDTTLVLIVSIFDLLGQIQASRSDPIWTSPTTAATGYLVAAMIYFVFCFGMSRYSMFMERRLNTGHKR